MLLREDDLKVVLGIAWIKQNMSQKTFLILKSWLIHSPLSVGFIMLALACSTSGLAACLFNLEMFIERNHLQRSCKVIFMLYKHF